MEELVTTHAQLASEAEKADQPLLVMMEHLNINVGDAALATAFYIEGLSCLVDSRGVSVVEALKPFDDQCTGLLWANSGLQQFHCPVTVPAQQFRATIHMQTCDGADTVLSRLTAVESKLQVPRLKNWLPTSFARNLVHNQGTQFSFCACAEHAGSPAVNVVCPWGNNFVVHCEGTGILYGPQAALSSAASLIGHPSGHRLGSGISHLAFPVPRGTCDGIAR
jgi:hypothetical protein